MRRSRRSTIDDSDDVYPAFDAIAIEESAHEQDGHSPIWIRQEMEMVTPYGGGASSTSTGVPRSETPENVRAHHEQFFTAPSHFKDVREVVERVSLFLPASDIGNLRLVCKRWSSATEDTWLHSTSEQRVKTAKEVLEQNEPYLAGMKEHLDHTTYIFLALFLIGIVNMTFGLWMGATAAFITLMVMMVLESMIGPFVLLRLLSFPMVVPQRFSSMIFTGRRSKYAVLLVLILLPAWLGSQSMEVRSMYGLKSNPVVTAECILPKVLRLPDFEYPTYLEFADAENWVLSTNHSVVWHQFKNWFSELFFAAPLEYVWYWNLTYIGDRLPEQCVFSGFPLPNYNASLNYSNLSNSSSFRPMWVYSYQQWQTAVRAEDNDALRGMLRLPPVETSLLSNLTQNGSSSINSSTASTGNGSITVEHDPLWALARPTICIPSLGPNTTREEMIALLPTLLSNESVIRTVFQPYTAWASLDFFIATWFENWLWRENGFVLLSWKRGLFDDEAMESLNKFVLAMVLYSMICLVTAGGYLLYVYRPYLLALWAVDRSRAQLEDVELTRQTTSHLLDDDDDETRRWS